MPLRPVPIKFTHRVEGESEPRYKGENGKIIIELPQGGTVAVEMYQRDGWPNGIVIRGLNVGIDVQPDASNTLIVKPRGI